MVPLRHWHKPSYWSWLWRERVGAGAKAALAVVALATLGLAGYLTAGKLEDGEQVVFTERMITVTRTTIVKGKPRVVTEVRTIRLKPGKPKTKIIRLNGKTVTVTTPGETVVSTRTVRGPLRTRTRTIRNTVVETQTKERLRTITLPGVTLPGSTVTGPERVVTLPERVVTAPNDTVVITQTGPTQTITSPTQTVTHTTTLPAQTVTNEVTVTETVTNTQTVTVTEPSGP